MNSFLKKHKYIIAILFLGLLLRLVFILFGAEYYFGRENIFVDGDTYAWRKAFMNLFETGTFTLNETEFGPFARMPGYSFFMGLFYFVCNQNWETAYVAIGWSQTILDVFAIYLFYRIAQYAFKIEKVALWAGFFYAIYPFVIVWNPVVYSESVSVVFMLLGLLFTIRKKRQIDFLFAGIFIGMAILNRPQLIILLAVIPIYVMSSFGLIRIKHWISSVLLFVIGATITYGAWPIRNYVNHNQLMLTQDLRGIKNWDVDVTSFLAYIYTVKAEWEPQFSSILQNKDVVFPPNAYTSYEDSILLVETIEKCKTCGSGFSLWKKYWKEPVSKENACNDEIANAFAVLKDNQLKENPFNVIVWIPLQNMYKALFKFSLTEEQNSVKKMASTILFLFRTVLIILGLIGVLVSYRKRNKIWIMGLYAVLVYLILCFGLGGQFRNIEMRYFLQADLILLLFVPAALFNFKILRNEIE